MSDFVHHCVGCRAGQRDYTKLLKIYNMPSRKCFSVSVFVVTSFYETVHTIVYQIVYSLSAPRNILCVKCCSGTKS